MLEIHPGQGDSQFQYAQHVREKIELDEMYNATWLSQQKGVKKKKKPKNMKLMQKI